MSKKDKNTPKNDAPKNDAPKNDALKNGGEAPQNGDAKNDSEDVLKMGGEAPKNDAPKKDSANDAPKDAPKNDAPAQEIAPEKTDDGLIKVYDTRNRIKRSISQEQIDLYPGRYKIV